MKNEERNEHARRFSSVLGANLALAREAAGLTQHALAERAGTSRATIAQIEAGEGDPRLSTLTSLADALCVSPFILILGREDALRLENLLDQRASVFDVAPAGPQLDTLTKLVNSRLPKDNRKAARLAADHAAAAGLPSTGSTVGSAIGTALLPGMGTAIGAFLGASEE